MNILCATDDNYVPYCGIMLTSLFETNTEENIHVYILTGGLNTRNKNILKNLASQYSQNIEIINVDADTFKDCPIRPDKDHVSIAAYYRLAVTKLLPTNLDRVLYLDCDMIVNSSLTDLYTIDLTGYACGVVADEAFMIDNPYERLSIPKNTKSPYFNSGMLLINLEYWKEHDIMGNCMKYISENASRLAFHDQDTLNAVLRSQVKYLPIRYNLQTGFLVLAVIKDLDKDFINLIRTNALSAAIIHFTGPSKPWVKKFRHPYVKHFLHYRSRSPFAHNPKLINPSESLYYKISYILCRIIWILGLKKRPWAYIIPQQKI